MSITENEGGIQLEGNKPSPNEIHCSVCSRGYKSKSGLRKHLKKIHPDFDKKEKKRKEAELKKYEEECETDSDDEFADFDEYMDEQDKEEEYIDLYEKDEEPDAKPEKEKLTKVEVSNLEMEKLKEEFKLLVEVNNININTKYVKNSDFDKIDKMKAEELKYRIRKAKQDFSKGIDKSITNGVLSISNTIIGTALNCLDDLNEAVNKNEILKTSVNQVISSELLIYIDPKIKMSGLYAVDIGTAYTKSRARRAGLLKAKLALELEGFDIIEKLDKKEEIEIPDIPFK